MESVKKRMISKINDADLSEEEKDLWFLFVARLKDSEVGQILSSIEDGDGNIDILTENLRAKVRAIRTKDREALKKVIEKEKNY